MSNPFGPKNPDGGGSPWGSSQYDQFGRPRDPAWPQQGGPWTANNPSTPWSGGQDPSQVGVKESSLWGSVRNRLFGKK